MDPPPRLRGTRRWPPAAAAGLALVLVLLVLPNPLRIPQNNPTAAAEYAPVPGRQENAQNANFGETNAASSSGIGAGGAGAGARPALPAAILPPPQFRPREKDCVGNPPRQTEDPLSPPCVPFFAGDNGGRTWVGVTKDEIKVVLYNDLAVEGDMNKPWKPTDESSGHQSNYEYTWLVRTIKAQLRYFQSRYQTYGRTVHVYAKPSSDMLTTTCDQRATDAEQSQQEFHPFAAVFLGDGAQCYHRALATQFHIPSFGLNSDVARKEYENYRPYIWGFFPDQEAEADWSASFICRRLKGYPARFTNDPLLKGRPRTFGFIYPTESQRGPELVQLSNLLIADLKKDCGMTFDDLQPYNGSMSTGSGSTEAPGIMARFKREGITTIVCYCIPVQTELTVGTMQNTASSIGYFPEWYWDHASRMFRAIWNRVYGDQKQPGFGVSQHWRNPAFRDQYHYQAYLSQEPGTVPNARFDFDIYHLFLNLFEAIQAAGPQLSPQSVERGMFTFNYQNAANPYEPVGGYGPYNPHAVANYTFVDTAMAWWWDPTGTPPGGTSNEGCLRAIDGGRRYFAGTWPRGDASVNWMGSRDPCYQDDTKLEDPQPGDF